MARPYNLDDLDRLARELEAAIPGLKVDLDVTIESQAQGTPSDKGRSVPTMKYSLDYDGHGPKVENEPVSLDVFGIKLADDIRNFPEIPHGLAVHILLERVERWRPR